MIENFSYQKSFTLELISMFFFHAQWLPLKHFFLRLSSTKYQISFKKLFLDSLEVLHPILSCFSTCHVCTIKLLHCCVLISLFASFTTFFYYYFRVFVNAMLIENMILKITPWSLRGAKGIFYLKKNQNFIANRVKIC